MKKENEPKENQPSVKLPAVPENSFLLRLGQGSSAWATSFFILADELGIKKL